jgi:hypothetical protein
LVENPSWKKYLFNIKEVSVFFGKNSTMNKGKNTITN